MSEANDKASPIDSIFMCRGCWVETATRKGKHKICRDMFITEYKDNCEIVIVKNGRISDRKPITHNEKNKMVAHYKLEPVNSHIFANAKTYRTAQSNNLVEWLKKQNNVCT